MFLLPIRLSHDLAYAIPSSPATIFHYEPEGLKCTECYPLFLAAFQLRGAGAVIHSHSQNAFMATVMYPGNEFVVTHIEMIKVSSMLYVDSRISNGIFYGYISQPFAEDASRALDPIITRQTPRRSVIQQYLG